MSLEALKDAERRRLLARSAFCAYCGADAPEASGLLAFTECGECDAEAHRTAVFCETCGGRGPLAGADLVAELCICRGRRVAVADGGVIGEGIAPVRRDEVLDLVRRGDCDDDARVWWLAVLGWFDRTGRELLDRPDVLRDAGAGPHFPPPRAADQVFGRKLLAGDRSGVARHVDDALARRATRREAP